MKLELVSCPTLFCIYCNMHNFRMIEQVIWTELVYYRIVKYGLDAKLGVDG